MSRPHANAATGALKTRRLGRTGLEISEIAFGTGQVGGLMIDGNDDAKLAALQAAIDGGVNWIDTAPQYGDGKSETAVGWALRELGISPFVSTKVRLGEADIHGDCTAAVARSVERSRARLGVERIDLLQLHNRIGTKPGMLASDVVAGPVFEAMAAMRERGLVAHLGLTALGDSLSCRSVMARGLFDTAQVYYNLLNPSAGETMPKRWHGQDFGRLLDVAAAHDMGVLAIRIFAAGALATGGQSVVPSDITSDSAQQAELSRARAVLASLPDDLAADPAGTALRFVLAERRVSAAVVGIGAPDHLTAALAAAAAGPLPKAAVAVLAAVYAAGFASRSLH